MSASTLTLGSAPASLTVVLVRGADFIAALDSLDGDWPDGIVVTLTFNDAPEPVTTWTATVDGEALDWNVDKAAVDTLIARLPENSARVRLMYVDGALDLLWAQGSISVRG